jgi:hypothetical protein
MNDLLLFFALSIVIYSSHGMTDYRRKGAITGAAQGFFLVLSFKMALWVMDYFKDYIP